MIEVDDNRARRTDPDTSHIAARISSLRKGKTDTAILEFLAARGPYGATSLEFAEETGRKHNNISPRFKPLARAGLISPTARRRINPETKCGSVVWVLRDYFPYQDKLL
ncbi:MAG: hypothetical protein OEV88_17080 [Gammaproteobacteria bacterium]|nr:hypothetical protein [Gammaproteobacteria bacterium]